MVPCPFSDLKSRHGKRSISFMLPQFARVGLRGPGKMHFSCQAQYFVDLNDVLKPPAHFVKSQYVALCFTLSHFLTTWG